jgi:hypothetical protein
MHYLDSLSNKLVAAYKVQEKLLTPSKPGIEASDTGLLADTLRAVLEQEVESGRLRYDLLRTHQDSTSTNAQSEPFFAGLLFHRG